MSRELEILHKELAINGYDVPKEVLEGMVLKIGSVDNSSHRSEYGKSEHSYQPTINNSVNIDLDRVSESLDSQTTFFLIAMAVEFIVVLVIGVVIGLLI